MAKSFIAPCGQLAEGHGGFGSTREVDDSISGREFLRRDDLVEDQGGQVVRVQAIADLVALAIKADVAHRSAAKVAIDPVGEDALVWTTELSGSSHDAAAVNENRETKCLAVF